MQLIPHARSAEHYARVERERLPGETFVHALTRLAVNDAVAATRTFAEAARLLGYRNAAGVHQIYERNRQVKVDAVLGHIEAHRRGPKPGTRWSEARHEARMEKRKNDPILAPYFRKDGAA